jgi:hypothetical protein
MNIKVYCSDCQHYLHSPLVANPDCCLAPLNNIVHDRWDGPRCHPISPPSDINAKNDCQMYEQINPMVLDTEIDVDLGEKPKRSLWAWIIGKTRHEHT